MSIKGNIGGTSGSGETRSESLPITMPSGKVKVYYIGARMVKTKDGPAERVAVHYEKDGAKAKFFAKNPAVQKDLLELQKLKLPVTANFEWATGGALTITVL